MNVNFAATLRLDKTNFPDSDIPAFTEIGQGIAIKHILETTDPDIFVTIRRRVGNVDGSEAVVEIRKQVDLLPDELKEYETPQKFHQFYFSKLGEVGTFSGTLYRLDALRSVIMDKIVELQKKLYSDEVWW